MNLSAMDHHPMHLHGHTFWITGTEAGPIPESAWIPSNTILVGVGQSKDVEFIANNPGDWMLHCHILHHMMNNMVSMVGPMPSMAAVDHPSHEGLLPETQGGDLASGELGAGLEPSLGSAIGEERAMMTILRVLPPDLYEKVVSGKGTIEPGESSPGAGSGKAMDHSGGGHEMHGDMPMPKGDDMSSPAAPASESSESGEHEH
jgi:hypothetical protein